MNKRLSRRFIIDTLDNLNLSLPIRYERYYINDTLRIQKKNNEYEKEILKENIVVKKEIISFDEFNLLKKDAYKQIIRDSYLYLNNKDISIKKYYGIYKELLRVEVSFEKDEDMLKYKKEKWMGEEITNSYLAFDKDLSKLNRKQFLSEISKYKA